MTNDSSGATATSSVRFSGGLRRSMERRAVVVKHAERVAHPQVHARRLDQRGSRGRSGSAILPRAAGWCRAEHGCDRLRLLAAAKLTDPRVRARARVVRHTRAAAAAPGRRAVHGAATAGTALAGADVDGECRRHHRLMAPRPRVLLDRPPDDVDQSGERDLERQHEPQKSPGHDRAIVSDRDARAPVDAADCPVSVTRPASR